MYINWLGHGKYNSVIFVFPELFFEMVEKFIFEINLIKYIE